MSLQAVKELFERVQADAVICNQLAQAETAQERFSLVRSAGYEFTREEFMQFKAQMPDFENDLVLEIRNCKDMFETGCCDVTD